MFAKPDSTRFDPATVELHTFTIMCRLPEDENVWGGTWQGSFD